MKAMQALRRWRPQQRAKPTLDALERLRDLRLELMQSGAAVRELIAEEQREANGA